MTPIKVWVHDGAVLSTGTNSEHEFAAAIHADAGHSVHGALDVPLGTSRADLEHHLANIGVEAFAVPVPHFRLEDWDGAFMYRLSMDERPGRGLVKVLIADRHRYQPDNTCPKCRGGSSGDFPCSECGNSGSKRTDVAP